MTTNDWLTISISGIALMFSVLTTVISLRQRSLDVQRNVRDQLSNIINELHTTFVEKQKLKPSFQPNKNLTPEESNRLRRIRNKNRFLVRQAVFLIEQLPMKLVSDMEYAEVAIALDTIGNIPQAELYWKKSVDAAVDDFYKSSNTKGYARFLVTHDRYDEARQIYKQRINAIHDNSDHMKYAKGELYRSWARGEAEVNSLSKANELFRKAETEYNSIQNTELKLSGLSNLNEAKVAVSNIIGRKI
ncbi:hypothetical protein QUF63_04735 [Anaerolineales bacterium HSG25]|nr:hypothetical protein [Anaerolineales bacterium HSG25]